MGVASGTTPLAFKNAQFPILYVTTLFKDDVTVVPSSVVLSWLTHTLAKPSIKGMCHEMNVF
jgi:hypothetical protein